MLVKKKKKRKCSFSHRGFESKNNLPVHVKFAKITNEFKTDINTLLADQNAYLFD